MYELCNVTGNTYYINCPAKIGIYINNNDAYLIDSGNDKDAGKKVKKILDEHGWNLKVILNTHSHADHIGGNKYLQQQTGCEIYAKGIEKDFTLHPILESAFLSGACPPKELMHKFLLAQDSECKDISECILPVGFEIIDLKGHSFEMIGIRTPDNVLFVADSISSQPTIDKYGISFIYDVEEYMKTLDRLSDLTAEYFVPSHAAVCDNLSEIISINKSKVNCILDEITELLCDELTFEELLASLFDKYSLNMTNEQYVLIGSTVKSYLTFLKNCGRVQSYFDKNMMMWKRI